MTKTTTHTSRLSRFYDKSIDDRLRTLFDMGMLSEEAQTYLRSGGGLDLTIADRMIENVVATQALPLSIALNFRINQRDVLVPMAVEEPSIVAAASNAARLIRIAGGFIGDADAAVMTTQVQLHDVPDVERACEIIDAESENLIAAANAAIPRMVARGGGCRDLEFRVVDPDEGMVVLHLYVDVGDAMGANLVDTVAEAVAPIAQRLIGGTIGLRILSNLPLRRMVRVSASVSTDAIGGAAIADGIVRASHFAKCDPFRAVTHNKGVMNGVDAVAVALGQDWRSIEAAAHAYAGLNIGYRPLATWTRTEGGIEGLLEMPMAVGTVGGSTRTHPGVRAAFELVNVKSARELAIVLASAGLASNLAALKALAGEGIQRGHMKLHSRKQAAEVAQQRRSTHS